MIQSFKCRGITADTDLRLSRLFGLSEGYFLRLQDHIETTLTKQKINTELTRIIPLCDSGVLQHT